MSLTSIYLCNPMVWLKKQNLRIENFWIIKMVKYWHSSLAPNLSTFIYHQWIILLGFSHLISSFIFAYAMVRASTIIFQSLIKKVCKGPMPFFYRVPTGRILNRFDNDVDIIDNVIIYSLRLWKGYLVEVYNHECQVQNSQLNQHHIF